MPQKIVRLFLFLLFALLMTSCLGPTPTLAAKYQKEVYRVRHWSNPTYTRVVIDVSGSGNAKYFHHLLKKDPSINVPHRRLYVDIYGTIVNKMLDRKIPIHDGLLKGARVGQYKKDTVRVVLDIESINDYKVFALSDPFRIIIDVTGEGFRKSRPAPLPIVITPRPGPGPVKIPPVVTTTAHKVKKIVIDPGHGGKDPGAVGKRKTMEKDITLRVSKMLKKKLKKATGADVLLTRSKDVYIPLEERTAIANTKRADLFISIHVNASPRRAARGVETYFLDVAHDKRTIAIAARENATTAESTGDLQFILNDLIRTANRNDSSNLAVSIQNSLVRTLKKKYSGIKGNGVKGAPFYVLVRTNMPSVLVEISFISNPTDEQRLKTEKYLQTIVDGITAGVLRFIEGMANNNK
ncbi:MAG: N-acetylmuramoyl-L-alanine amidase [Thermodesulfobacteriota bacterium]